MFAAMFTCARVAGWSAHVLEEKRTGRLIRPSARYIGPGTRPASSVAGWDVPTATSDALRPPSQARPFVIMHEMW